MNIEIILRTCNRTEMNPDMKRILKATRDELILRCLNSFLLSVNHLHYHSLGKDKVNVTIIDDSTNDFRNKIKQKIILHVLSRGNSKTLVISRLPSDTDTDNRIARRIDFLYAPLDEYAFALLYFTGSKIFNTVMRQKALDQGYTFNEHGIYYLTDKK